MIVENYPEGLIPKCGWKPCIKTEELIAAVPDSIVARRLDGSKEDYIDSSLGEENSFLKSDAFRDSRLIDMSMSLLGALLEVKDMGIRQVKPGSDDWEGKEVDASKLIDECAVEVASDWFCICWQVSNLHQKQFPYMKHVEKKNFKALKDSVANVSKVVLGEFEDYLNGDIILSATTNISHKPTMLNYWHFTFNVTPADTTAFIKKLGKTWSDTLFADINKTLFRYNFSFARPDGVFPAIPHELWEMNK